MQIITAKRASSPIKNGCTKPYYIICDDGEIYAVKFKQNPEGPRVLANEFVCSKLAKLLDLPVPTPAIISVEKRFIEDFGNQISAHVGEDIKPGYHFGTQKIDKVFPIENADMLKSAQNKFIIPEILLFDHWIGNSDRESNKGNLLFNFGKMEIAVIDHTHAFELGPIWTAADLKQRIGESIQIYNIGGNIYKKLVPFINGFNPFHAIQTKMSGLTSEDLWYIINSTPEEWELSDEEKAVLLEYLVDRLYRMDEVLEKLKPHLPYWKGGS